MYKFYDEHEAYIVTSFNPISRALSSTLSDDGNEMDRDDRLRSFATIYCENAIKIVMKRFKDETIKDTIYHLETKASDDIATNVINLTVKSVEQTHAVSK